MKTTKNMTKTIVELSNEVMGRESEEAKYAIRSEATSAIMAVAEYNEDTEVWEYDEKTISYLLMAFRDTYRRGARDAYAAMQNAVSAML